MNYRYLIIALMLIGSITTSYAQSDIPNWIKSSAGYWSNDEITNDEFISLIQWLVNNNIITVLNQDDSQKVLELENELSKVKK